MYVFLSTTFLQSIKTLQRLSTVLYNTFDKIIPTEMTQKHNVNHYKDFGKSVYISSISGVL